MGRAPSDRLNVLRTCLTVASKSLAAIKPLVGSVLLVRSERGLLSPVRGYKPVVQAGFGNVLNIEPVAPGEVACAFERLECGLEVLTLDVITNTGCRPTDFRHLGFLSRRLSLLGRG